MKTIRLEEPGRFALLSTDEPATSLNPEQALVRVRRIGVCGTDIHAFGGNQPFFTYPRILGHELGVEVVAVGSSTKNVVPLPASDSIQICPPCRSTMRLQRANPIPVPG